jgi:aryl-alcohol dehydrogenase-like predicted oxidoreductase
MSANEPTRAPRVPLGRTGIAISPVGVGTWQWGDARFWGYGRGDYTDADLLAAFGAALAGGLNFFDTAELYGGGRSETLLGQCVGQAEAEVVVASKYLPWPWRRGAPGLRDALRASLDRLELERLDLYYIHWPLYWWPGQLERLADALADVVAAGLTRAVGVSNHNVRQMQRVARVLGARGVPLAANQVRYSLLDRRPERTGLLAACRRLGITLVAYSPLAQGLLTGKYSPAHPPPGPRARLVGRQLSAVPPVVAGLRAIGAAHGGKTCAQVALNWLVSKGAVPIPGAKTAWQAVENAGALGWRLTDAEIRQLDQVSAWAARR